VCKRYYDLAMRGIKILAFAQASKQCQSFTHTCAHKQTHTHTNAHTLTHTHTHTQTHTHHKPNTNASSMPCTHMMVLMTSMGFATVVVIKPVIRLAASCVMRYLRGFSGIIIFISRLLCYEEPARFLRDYNIYQSSAVL